MCAAHSQAERWPLLMVFSSSLLPGGPSLSTRKKYNMPMIFFSLFPFAMATTLQGDTWRIKHDTVKSELNRLCVWSSLPATCEVCLFSQLIPQEGLNRLERGRKRQAMVQDLQLEIPCPTGGKVSRLAELKVLNCCPTCYSPGDGDKPVEPK